MEARAVAPRVRAASTTPGPRLLSWLVSSAMHLGLAVVLGWPL